MGREPTLRKLVVWGRADGRPGALPVQIFWPLNKRKQTVCRDELAAVDAEVDEEMDAIAFLDSETPQVHGCQTAREDAQQFGVEFHQEEIPEHAQSHSSKFTDLFYGLLIMV